MILIFAFALAVAWGLVRGGRLSHIASFPMRGYGIALAAVGIQIGVIYLLLPRLGNSPLHVILLVMSYALLAVFIWLNRQLPGMWLIAIGFVANWSVILANGGFMPITYEAVVAAGLGRAVTNAATGTLVFGSKDILLHVLLLDESGAALCLYVSIFISKWY